MGGLGGREERATLFKGFLLFPSPQPPEAFLPYYLTATQLLVMETRVTAPARMASWS